MKRGPGLECRNEARRHLVRDQGWNGLDYVEVWDHQDGLTVYLLGQAPEDLGIANLRIEGCQPGAREVRVIDFKVCNQRDDERDECLHIGLDRPGDFSKYRLCVVELDGRGRPTERPFHGFDPRYACLEVDFKVGCPSELDCKTEPVCPAEPRVEPDIHYLAKDYASFRQLLLDRLALIMPEWRERHVPDLGVALVELLAYVGDHLSYYQDAVATEAYLGTARRRISVRRHVRLIDYAMHEGCNARAWVHLEVKTDQPFEIFPGDFCITGFPGGPAEGRPLQPAEVANFAGLYLVFEPVFGGDEKVVLIPEHNEIPFYTWGDRECCLPRGATRATLLDVWLPSDPWQAQQEAVEAGDHGKPPQEKEAPPPPTPPEQERPRKLKLQAGDLLLFEEVRGPKTHHEGDADLSHRHVVRLTRAHRDVDRLCDQPVVEIEWAAADALPFPLCLSSIGPPPGCELQDVSVARGNVFLVDHGETIPGEELKPAVPGRETAPACEGEGLPAEEEEVADRFRPRLERGPLTFRAPFPQPFRDAPASLLLAQDPRQALPQILRLDAGGASWQPRGDLLASGPADPCFTVEVDDDGNAWLRFGDGDCGRLPPARAQFKVDYRVGNGPEGNVGIGAIRHLVLKNRTLDVGLTVRNPLAARGGTAAEPLEEVRLLAPHAFRQDLQRAVTAEDYALLVERDFRDRVQRAAATLRWTGSWYEVLVAVDPEGGKQDESLLAEVEQKLRHYRRIGHDVAVRWAVPVALLVKLSVCVRSGYLRGHVEAALREALSNRRLPDGRRGFFHPDNLTFGQRIALSRLVEAAQAVTGVESVLVEKLERLGLGDREVAQGFLPLGPLEVAILDNDVRAPANGRLELKLEGGR
jgi:hypothetical protein